MASAQRTTDHQTIQSWVESRGGKPAHVARTGSGDDPGVLRIDFPGYSGGQSLQPLDWDDWFEAFESNGLAFLHQDKTADGEVSRFSKLVRRSDDDELADSRPYKRGERRKGRTTGVDINSATEEELDALWGVGPATARKIIQHRKKNGRIDSLDDLVNVDGIDGATVENLKREVEAGGR